MRFDAGQRCLQSFRRVDQELAKLWLGSGGRGLIIAAVGCQRGLDTGTGAVAVGLSTTRSVVAGILLTILADGLFAGIYFALGI